MSLRYVTPGAQPAPTKFVRLLWALVKSKTKNELPESWLHGESEGRVRQTPTMKLKGTTILNAHL